MSAFDLFLLCGLPSASDNLLKNENPVKKVFQRETETFFKKTALGALDKGYIFPV